MINIFFKALCDVIYNSNEITTKEVVMRHFKV